LAAAAPSDTGREPEPPEEGVLGDGELGEVMPLFGNEVSLLGVFVVFVVLAMEVSG
jgi:hypothetical protein